MMHIADVIIRHQFLVRNPFLFNTFKASLILGLALFFFAPAGFGQQYFQQQTNYTINVTLNDEQHRLDAIAHLTYINYSPDTLHYIYFHLYPNAYSDNNTALARQIMRHQGRQRLFNDTGKAGNINVEGFIVEKQNLSWYIDEIHSDIVRVCLPFALLPNDSILFTIPFNVKIPASGISRMGYEEQSYQISQWYPKPAVYDVNGWHPMPYLDQGEFYSDFGNYIVNITLPSNYRVGASGKLLSAGEIKFLQKIAADTAWKDESDLSVPKIPPSDNQQKTIRFSASDVHDFAWFADKRYHVLLDSIQLGSSGKMVYLTSMFTSRQSELWSQSLEYLKSAMYHFSALLGHYPYSQYTLVQGALGAGSGMEYPGAAIIGFVKDDYYLHQVIVHEMLHSWFYGALASDERKYPYMDESLVSALESHYITALYPNKKLWKNYILEEKTARFFKLDKLPLTLIAELEWLYALNNNLEQPLNLPADKYSEEAYYNMIYNKGANAFNYLRNYLGDSVFFKGLSLYFNRWKHKHPAPSALQQAFTQVTNKDLEWFFNDILTTTKRLDYAISGYDSGQLLIKNKGQLTAPVVLSGLKGDSVVFTTWLEGFMSEKWIDVVATDIDRFIIDPDHLMIESRRLNNNFYKEGLFKKRDPLKTQLIATLNRPEERLLLYFPAVNYTEINGFMPGLGFQNHFIVPRPFEFLVLPFYSFKISAITGYANFNLSLLPRKPGSKVNVRVEASRFGAPGAQNYHRLNLGFEYRLIPDMLFYKNSFRYFISAAYLSDIQQIIQRDKADWIPLISAGIEILKHSTLHPYNVLMAAEGNNFFAKASLTSNFRYSYYGKNRGLDVRFFGGVRLHLDSDKPVFGLSPSARSGSELYTFDGTYFDRFSDFGDSFFSRQTSITEGGIISSSNFMAVNPMWLVSVTLSSNLPWNLNLLNIKPFATMVLMEKRGQKNTSSLLAEVGLKTGIAAFFEIYVPLILTHNLHEFSPKIKDRIRFTLNLDFLSKIGEVL